MKNSGKNYSDNLKLLILALLALFILFGLVNFLLFQREKHSPRTEEIYVADHINPFEPSVFDTVVIKATQNGYVQFECLDKKLRSTTQHKFKLTYSKLTNPAKITF